VEVTCSFCGGHGKDPFGIMSWLSTCCVCGGRGVVRVAAPARPCAHCRGTGAVKTFTCTVCRGTGFVPLTPGPRLQCPECRGTGADAASGLACLSCRGRGWVPSGESKILIGVEKKSHGNEEPTEKNPPKSPFNKGGL
jgi:DnaJ-class molecular chaperone